jgi:hypothetical protein
MFATGRGGWGVTHVLGMFKITGCVSMKCALLWRWVEGFRINAFGEFNFSTFQENTGARISRNCDQAEFWTTLTFSERNRNVLFFMKPRVRFHPSYSVTYQGYSDQSLKLSIVIHLVPRLRMNGVIPQILYTFSLQSVKVSAEVFLYSEVLK